MKKSPIHQLFIKYLAAIIILPWLSSYSLNSYAAYCSLRDPVAAMKLLYPEATHHLPITREVNRKDRDHISKNLPFTLLFNELGKHTLYVVMNNNTPVGFIHARSELTDSGLIEIAWAINLDMTIKDSYFQRCRDPRSRNPIFIADMKKLINHKSSDELLSLTNQYTEEQSNLLYSVIKSALKTIATTETVWKKDIEEARRKKLLHSTFNKKENIETIPLSNSQVKEGLQNTISFSMIKNDSISFYRVVDKKTEIALLVQADWSQYGFHGNFTWIFSPEGKVLAIAPSKPWPTLEIATAFNEVAGMNVSNEENCSTATSLAGAKLFALGQRHNK